jgi:ABC-2 type transport system permease protein
MSIPTASTAAPTTTGVRRPGWLALGFDRARLEMTSYFRLPDAVAFTLAFPVMMLLLFSLIFHGDIAGGVRYEQVLLAGILASGVASTSFVSLAISVAIERSNGTIKRLAGTPLSAASYFVGKIVLVLVTGLLEAVLLFVVAVLFFSVHLPTDVGHWVTFAWVFALGLTACTLCGLAFTRVIRSEKSAGAVVNLPFVALQFISGVWVRYDQLPAGVRAVATVFPLKWMAQGFRSVLLPDRFLAVEPSHSWQHGWTAAVLLAWCILGFVITARTFRWRGEDRR